MRHLMMAGRMKMPNFENGIEILGRSGIPEQNRNCQLGIGKGLVINEDDNFR